MAKGGTRVNLQHCDGAKDFGIVLNGRCHVILYVLLLDLLRNQTLRLLIEWIRIQHTHALIIATLTLRYMLAQQTCKRLHVTRIQCLGQPRVVLTQQRQCSRIG